MLDDRTIDKKLDHIQSGVTDISDVLLRISDDQRRMALSLRRLLDVLTPDEKKDSGLRETLGNVLTRIEDHSRQLHDIGQVIVDMTRTLPPLIAEAVVNALRAART